MFRLSFKLTFSFFQGFGVRILLFSVGSSFIRVSVWVYSFYSRLLLPDNKKETSDPQKKDTGDPPSHPKYAQRRPALYRPLRARRVLMLLAECPPGDRSRELQNPPCHGEWPKNAYVAWWAFKAGRGTAIAKPRLASKVGAAPTGKQRR